MSHGFAASLRRIDVSEQTRAVDTLSEPDYGASWEVAPPGGDERSAEQWARATFEEAPNALRAFIVAGWSVGLGLRLGPRPSPDYVLGWRILTNTPDLIIMTVQSALLGTAHLVFEVESSRVRLTSFVRYEMRSARPIWSAVQPIHHQVVPYLLGRAASQSPKPDADLGRPISDPSAQPGPRSGPG